MSDEYERAEHSLTSRAVYGDGTNIVPRYMTGCSNCGCVWDMFYISLTFMGPPDYCPRCGAKVIKDK